MIFHGELKARDRDLQKRACWYVRHFDRPTCWSSTTRAHHLSLFLSILRKVAGECCGEDAARRIKGIGADFQDDAWIRRFLVQPNATTDTSRYPLISSSEVFFSSERSSNSRRDSATSETTWPSTNSVGFQREVQTLGMPVRGEIFSRRGIPGPALPTHPSGYNDLQKRAAMLHRYDMFDSTGYIRSKYWLRGSGKYAFLWHMKSEEMKSFTQEQTFKKYVNDVKTDSKGSQQGTADTIMPEASAAATKEAIEAIVALALTRDTGTAGKMTCIARLPRAVRTIWSFCQPSERSRW
ncbi:hypothetical protein V1527DRAFT_450196 [Lipomyces starkeyi]